MDLVLATRNQGKVEEMRPMLASVGFSLINQTDTDIPSAVEDGATFVENALIKARSVAKATGLPSIADDSGLVVRALHGAPGIYSARYAGEDASDADNNQRLLEALGEQSDRRAALSQGMQRGRVREPSISGSRHLACFALYVIQHVQRQLLLGIRPIPKVDGAVLVGA